MINSTEWTNLFVVNDNANNTACQILRAAVSRDVAMYRYTAMTERGFDLLDFGAFPALITGDFSVGGDVLLVAPEVIYELDFYESYPRLYTRKTIMLWTDMDEVSGERDNHSAEAYIFDADADDSELLLRGLYRKTAFGGIHQVSKTVKSWWE